MEEYDGPCQECCKLQPFEVLVIPGGKPDGQDLYVCPDCYNELVHGIPRPEPSLPDEPDFDPEDLN